MEGVRKMGIQRIRTCDRCGKEFDYRGITAGYFVNGVRKSNILHFRVLFDGNSDGYSYSEYRVELCADCTSKLLDFLFNKEG